jgi:hypothetical protein
MKLGRNKKWTGIVAVLVIMTGLGIVIAINDPPLPLRNSVILQCQWYDPVTHGLSPATSTIDASTIQRLSDEMAKGRKTLGIGKTRIAAVIKFRDVHGKEQIWSLHNDHSISQWGKLRT